jgi:hypothetical protein
MPLLIHCGYGLGQGNGQGNGQANARVRGLALKRAARKTRRKGRKGDAVPANSMLYCTTASIAPITCEKSAIPRSLFQRDPERTVLRPGD